jgi:ABC-type sugar transport system ATPase subunit
MADIRLEKVSIRLGHGSRTFTLSDLDLHIKQGEFIVIVGGSGTGKSTLLRAVAGLEEISDGAIWIGDRRIDKMPPAQRGLAMVFQNYALYPNMTVAENIGFSLRLARRSKADIAEQVLKTARRLQIDHLLARKPSELSGGQRQRVAIGRAIVRNPQAFLFDEPLSNLDTGLRNHLRVELLSLHKQLGVTSLYVTHDQVEAMTLADRIVLLSTTGVEQIGTLDELFESPRNAFVAKFIGTPAINLVSSQLVREAWAANGSDGRLSDAVVTIGFRSRRARLADVGHLRGSVILVERLGDTGYVHVKLESQADPVVITVRNAKVVPGENVSIELEMDHLLFFDAAGNCIDPLLS